MTRKDHRRSGASPVRLALAVLAILAIWPRFQSGTTAVARAQAGPSPALLQPSTLNLEAAFDLVGRGQLPAGYPQSTAGWLAPTSLLKAIAWTESTWRQFDAAQRTLVSADGGYGLMQITSGMEPGGLPDLTQSAIAHNFLYNLSYGAQVLITKWLQTPNIGNDDPSILEHWYYALWAYNGWGWVNNPNNPAFARMGTPATDPASWPYQERVLYWLAHPPRGKDGAPLWPSIPATLPAADQIGVSPGPLAETASPHFDVAMPAPALDLSTLRDATYLKDVSVPDGQVMRPGAHFRKVWKLQNRGFDTWGPGYRWAPAGGTAMGAPAGVPVAITPPQAQVAVAVDLVAPNAPGAYREYWRMLGPDRRPFGVRAWVDIRVAGHAVPAAAATPTGGGFSDAGATGSAPTPSQAGMIAPAANVPVAQGTATQAAVTGDAAIYAGDVSVPDGTVLQPGQAFVKTWRIKNIGSTTWETSFRWRFEAGTLMSKVTVVPAPRTVPGSTAIISVPMVAPASTGVYTSFWQMTNTAGHAFPHQAWVNIIVRAQKGNASPTSVPATVAAATATPTPPGPTSTPQPPAAPPQPTVDIQGGGGQMVSSPWVGSLAYRTFFAEGGTIGNTRETIGVYFPGNGIAHVRVTLYRPDAAQRMLSFALGSGARRVLALNRIAPGTGLSVTVEADRQVVVERATTAVAGALADPGAARTARTWLFPAVPEGAPADQQLVLFNPHDETAVVTVRIGLPQGGCCAGTMTVKVPPLAQYRYRMGSSATLRGPMTLFASNVVAAERIVISPDGGTVVGVPGTVIAANDWYLPSVHSDRSGGAVVVFNPGTKPVLATVHMALDEGAGTFQQRSVPPFGQIAVPIAGMTTAVAAAAVVNATGPVVVGAVRNLMTGLPSVSSPSAVSARNWSLLAGLAGHGYSESIDILNPTAASATIDVQVIGSRGQAAKWRITMPPHSRYSRLLGSSVPSGGAVILVRSSQPVTVGRTISSDTGTASSPGFPLQTP